MLRTGGSLLLLGLLALALAGCETTAEKSAVIAKRFHRERSSQHGLSIARANPQIKVLSTVILHGEGGTAVAVTLRSDAPHALVDVPLAITVRRAGGKTTYQNDAPGLEASLTSVPLLVPGRDFTWVDDQLPAGAYPGTVEAEAGEASSTESAAPTLSARDAHIVEDPANGPGVHGTIVDGSSATAEGVVVFVTALRAGRIVAAGRALLTSVAPRASSPFEAFLLGDPRGARLQISVGARAASG